MIVNQAYRFALDPTPAQVRALASHAGASRKAFNWALGLVKAQLDQRDAERSYGIPTEELTPFVSWTLPSPRKRWNEVKNNVAPWWAECSKEAYASGIRNLVRGLDAWRDSKSGRRTGPSVRFPRFKSKRREQMSCTSTGETVANPRHLAAASRRLRRAARRMSRRNGPDTRARQKPSKRWLRTRAELGRAHTRVANLRRDGLHKLTTRLAREYGTVVVEHLNVAGMVRNRRLAKAISDCGFATIRQQVVYKTVWNGGRLVVADRWFPSSKTCSGCGAVKAKLPLRVRTFVCTECGMTADRDLNAARNLALLASVTGAGVAVHPEPKGSNGRGADRKTPTTGQVAAKRPPGTASAGQTGTVPPQGGTSNHVLTRAR